MNITVYCGASLGNNSAYQTAATKLGEMDCRWPTHFNLWWRKIRINGRGCRYCTYSSRQSNWHYPSILQDREVSHPNLTKTMVVESMSERKNKMIELGDAYIALPGGPGTLEEIAEVISWARIGKNNNPCILFNEKGYFDSLKSFLAIW